MDNRPPMEARQVWELRLAWLLQARHLHQVSRPTAHSLDGRVAFLKVFSLLPTCQISISTRQSYVWERAGRRSQAHLWVLIQGGESLSNDQLGQVLGWMHNGKQSEKA